VSALSVARDLALALVAGKPLVDEEDLMSDADEAVWAACATAADVRAATVLWLTGAIRSQPGYCGPVDVDEDDAPGLTDALVALNRAGVLTNNSQAGADCAGFDGAHWQQFAAVDGLADDATVGWLVESLFGTGLQIAVNSWVDVTFRDGRRYTRFGGEWSRKMRRHLRDEWTGYGVCQSSAVDELLACRRVVMYDPAFGRDDRLWPTLRAAAEAREGAS
jgi:hypothetical protein